MSVPFFGVSAFWLLSPVRLGVDGALYGVEGALFEATLDAFCCEAPGLDAPRGTDGEEGVLAVPLGGLLGVFILLR